MRPYPPLVKYTSKTEYKLHYEQIYCKSTINTHDGIAVRFRKNNFNHIFFESSKRNGIKDIFSNKRAERIDWILATLQDSTVPMYIGWNKKKKRYDKKRRVVISQENYIVVIHLTNTYKANHITAFVADLHTISKIKTSPVWT